MWHVSTEIQKSKAKDLAVHSYSKERVPSLHSHREVILSSHCDFELNYFKPFTSQKLSWLSQKVFLTRYYKALILQEL